MEESRNVQIVYAGRTNLCKRCTTDHARGIMKLGISQQSHYFTLLLGTISPTGSESDLVYLLISLCQGHVTEFPDFKLMFSEEWLPVFFIDYEVQLKTKRTII